MTVKTVFESSLVSERYTKIEHESGLRIFVFPKRTVSAYACISVPAGSIDNRYRIEAGAPLLKVPDGTAHFLEHQLFESESGTDATARFAALGANADAYTSNDITAYLFSCTENLRENLAVLLDFVTHPYFTKETVKKERGIIEQELRMYEDNPAQLCYYNLLKAMYEAHPIRVNVGGTVRSIASVTPDVLYRFYDAFYRLSDMKLYVAGNITPDEVIAVCDEVLPHTGKRLPPVERVYPAEKPSVRKALVRDRAQVSMPMVCLGVKDTAISADPAERMKKTAAVNVLNDILFCKSAPFFNELYGKGLINGRLDTEFEHTAAFSFATICTESAKPDEVADRIRAFIEEKQRTHDISKAQFERCRKVMYAAAVTSFESAEDTAGSCLDFETDDGELFAGIDIMAAVTPEDVFYALDTFYRSEAIAVSIVEPQ